MAKALGKPVSQLTWAFVGEAIPTGTQADNDYADAAKLGGGKVVYNQAVVPVNGGNLAPIVNAVEATKPDVVWVVTGSQAIAVKSAWTYVLTTTPVLEENTPFVQQMIGDYTAAGIPSKDITFGGEYAYPTADNMIALLKKIAPNFGAVESTLKSGFSYSPTTGGSPINYPFMFDAPTNCSSVLKVVNAVYTTATPFGCSTGYINIAGGGATPTTEPSPPG